MKKFKFKRKSTIIIIAIIILFILASYLGLTKYTTKYIRLIINPIIRSAHYTGSALGDFFSLYLNRSDLDKKNQELNRRLVELAKENIELKLLQQENQLLKKELEFLDATEYQYVLARVLGRGPDYLGTDLLIDKGKKHGLYNGLPVTSEQGVMVGKIYEVQDNISHVKLLIDNRSKLSVVVAGQQSALGLIHGEHNINLKIDMLPKDAQIAIGDLVTTAGIDQNIPAGFLIGTLANLANRQESPWQTATVEPAINYRRLKIVTVIKP